VPKRPGAGFAEPLEFGSEAATPSPRQIVLNPTCARYRAAFGAAEGVDLVKYSGGQWSNSRSFG
jgi:hypothetical protein